MRDSLGKFVKGHTESAEDKLKRLEAFKQGWKKSPRYIDNLVKEQPYIYNSWRAFMFTKRGKMAGVCERWKSFKNFYDDMASSYIDGHRLIRVDKTKPFSMDNCVWISDKDKSIFLDNTVFIEYKNERLSIKEWASKLDISSTSIAQRYRANVNRGNYTNEEILFGKRITQARNRQDISELSSEQKIRAKASKMISSYRNTDKKRNRECSLTIDWFIENILRKSCYYCGEKKNVGCDRINNAIGHTINNVVPCCYDCNISRHDNFTHDEMMILGKTIREIKNNRNQTAEYGKEPEIKGS